MFSLFFLQSISTKKKSGIKFTDLLICRGFVTSMIPAPMIVSMMLIWTACVGPTIDTPQIQTTMKTPMYVQCIETFLIKNFAFANLFVCLFVCLFGGVFCFVLFCFVCLGFFFLFCFVLFCFFPVLQGVTSDNCASTCNPDQHDFDSDSIGDACDHDRDADGVADPQDNCPFTSNPVQEDRDNNGVGDACDSLYQLYLPSDQLETAVGVAFWQHSNETTLQTFWVISPWNQTRNATHHQVFLYILTVTTNDVEDAVTDSRSCFLTGLNPSLPMDATSLEASSGFVMARGQPGSPASQSSYIWQYNAASGCFNPAQHLDGPFANESILIRGKALAMWGAFTHDVGVFQLNEVSGSWEFFSPSFALEFGDGKPMAVDLLWQNQSSIRSVVCRHDLSINSSYCQLYAPPPPPDSPTPYSTTEVIHSDSVSVSDVMLFGTAVSFSVDGLRLAITSQGDEGCNDWSYVHIYERNQIFSNFTQPGDGQGYRISVFMADIAYKVVALEWITADALIMSLQTPMHNGSFANGLGVIQRQTKTKEWLFTSVLPLHGHHVKVLGHMLGSGTVALGAWEQSGNQTSLSVLLDDRDNDGVANVHDYCPTDAFNDADSDGLCMNEVRLI